MKHLYLQLPKEHTELPCYANSQVPAHSEIHHPSIPTIRKIQHVKESHYSTNLISQKGKIFNSVVARSPLQHHFTNYIINVLKFITKNL